MNDLINWPTVANYSIYQFGSLQRSAKLCDYSLRLNMSHNGRSCPSLVFLNSLAITSDLSPAELLSKILRILYIKRFRCKSGQNSELKNFMYGLLFFMKNFHGTYFFHGAWKSMDLIDFFHKTIKIFHGIRFIFFHESILFFHARPRFLENFHVWKLYEKNTQIN